MGGILPTPKAPSISTYAPRPASDPSADEAALRVDAIERRRVWQQHWQFSCWNENDPNREKILSVEPGHRVFDTCIRIARRAVSGCFLDVTKGATHYHIKSVMPPWSRGKPVCAEIGRHLFYNSIE